MEIFNSPNHSGAWKCPICGTNKESLVTLISVDGTREGKKMQTIQVHISCLDLVLYEIGPVKFISQDIREDTLE